MNMMWQACGAELALLAVVVLLTVLESIWPRRGGRAKGFVALAGIALAFFALPAPGAEAPGILAGVWAVDRLAVIFKVILLVAAALALFMSIDEFPRRAAAAGEYVILVLLAAVGMMIMVAGKDLLVIVLGLELMAISFYILTGFSWFREATCEGALKYVMTGLFASALLLYGISLIYGAAGGTSLEHLAALVRGGKADSLVLAGLAFLACGLAFKMGAAPFQMWMPDVLEGAPTPVAGYLAVGPKVAVLAVAARLFVGAFPSWAGLWAPLWWSLAALTILWGNLAALAQASVKRMLAYSSIAHVGYLLIALVASSGRDPGAAIGAMAFYLLAYAFMNLGAFGTLLWFERTTGEEITWRDLAGKQRRSPMMAFLFSLFMFSLAGIPPTAGFAGKFWVFLAGWKAGYPGLVLLAALGSLIGAFYYLRVVYAIYLLPGGDEAEAAPAGGLSVLAYAVFLAATGTVLAGVLPQFFMQLAAQAAVY